MLNQKEKWIQIITDTRKQSMQKKLIHDYPPVKQY